MIEEFSFLGFPLCSREVRKIAHDFAEANGFEGFSKQSNEAGRKWFAFLLKRYPKLKVKEGVTNLSITRAKASNHDSVTTWYKKYQNVLDQLEITDPRYIWNIDEHGSEDMPKVKKIHWAKGNQAIPKAATRKTKANHHADLCECSRVCSSSTRYPQGEVPRFMEEPLPLDK